MKHLVMGGLFALLSSTAFGQALINGQPPASPQVDAVKAQVDTLMLVQAQSIDATLDASGNFTWTYPIAFVAPPRVAYFPQNSDISGKPIVCNWQTRTSIALTFHCDKGTGKVVNLLQDIFSVTGAGGAVVTVTARGTLVAPPPMP